MFVEKDNKHAVVCQIKISAECLQTGDFCDSEEDADEWVENECWINSGEGWICPRCNEQILKNIGKIKLGERL